VRLLPQPYYGEQTRDARVQLPGGTVAYLVVSFGPPHPPGAGDTHPWFELNFDPEKGPVHGW